MPAGYWCPVLHAHLPYVRHPEYPEFLEEDWFFEALSETYVPLVRVLDGLLQDGVDYRLTMTLSPPLLSMMQDDLLVGRYHRYLDRLVDLSHREVERTQAHDHRFAEVARFYAHEFTDIRRIFRETYSSDIVRAFRKHRDAGQAGDHHLRRHPRLPAPHGDGAPGGARADPGGGDHYRKVLGRDPSGIWLPECGYYPGVEEHLREGGIRFGFLESHGLTDAHPRPRFGEHAPLATPGGVVFFGRDMESSRQVWSSESGYPGDHDYREFYKDVGWELPMDYLRTSCPTARGRTSASSTTGSRARWAWATSSPTCGGGRSRRPPPTPRTSWGTGRSRSSTWRGRRAGGRWW